jgi:predicted TIM-barrel fold metal-dependent hydrolase
VSYIEGRTVHDADAHIMETPNWLRSYADPAIRDRIEVPGYANELKQTGDEPVDLDATFARLADRHRSEEFLTDEAAQVMVRKNFAATGSFLAEDRPRVLDFIGVRSQLLFNTVHNGRLFAWERTRDLELTAGVARAHNRGMLDFCSVDERLFATAYVPLVDFDLAAEIAGEAIAAGAGALLVGSDCPPEHSPSHRELDRVWSQAAEARIPIVFHVGGTGDLLSPAYFNNGLPIPPDFHGGDENFRSVDYMGIAHPPMQTIAAMIFDGVFERFPDLRLGVIEQGAVWLPSFCKRMESAFDAFHRHEERLQALSMRPTEYVQRQIRATPYPTEDVGWITDNLGPDVCLFSTDYPHVEGGRDPYGRFERSLGDRSDAIRQAFYCDNMADLMGPQLVAA